MAALKNKLILQGAPLYNRWSSVRSNVNALAFRQFSFLFLGRIWWQTVYILVSSYLMKQWFYVEKKSLQSVRCFPFKIVVKKIEIYIGLTLTGSLTTG